MVLLQALHRAMAITSGGDALHGVVGTGKRGDVRHLVLDGGLLVELGGSFGGVNLEAELLENAASRMSRQAACGLA